MSDERFEELAVDLLLSTLSVEVENLDQWEMMVDNAIEEPGANGHALIECYSAFVVLMNRLDLDSTETRRAHSIATRLLSAIDEYKTQRRPDGT